YIPHTHLALFFIVPATTAIYTLSLHDALPISPFGVQMGLLYFYNRFPFDDGTHANGQFKGINQTGPTPSIPLNNLLALGEGKIRSEEHTSELQSRFDLVCRLLLEKKNKKKINT